jgi:hypothetical protein
MSGETEEYPYQDQFGNDSYKVVRRGRGKGKEFYIKSKHGSNGAWKPGLNGQEPLPYKLPEVTSAINRGETIYIVEGEQDVDTAFKEGVVATCNHGGAGKWTDEHSKRLRGAMEIILVWDRDKKGVAHVWGVRDSLRRVGGIEKISFKRAAFGKDLTDHISEGGRVGNLVNGRPPRPEPKNGKVEISDEHPDRELPIGFRLVRSLLNGVKAESGKFHQYNAICPAHDDHSPSLSVRLDPDNGNTLLTCQADCTFDQIIAALGLSARDLMGNVSNHEALVEQRYNFKKADAEARERILEETISNVLDVNEAALTLADKIKNPPPEVPFLFDSLMPYDTKTLLNAEQKIGKSRFCMAVIKAYADREPLLGHWQTNIEEGGKVGYLNLEMGARQSYEWLKQADIKHPENVLVIDANGFTVPIWTNRGKAEMVRFLKRNNIKLLIVDTLASAANGLLSSENDNLEWYKYFNVIDEIRVMGECPNVLIIHHIGKATKDRGRGASAIEAWPDALWYLTTEGTFDERFSQDTPRIFKAIGRDVLVPHAELDFDLETGLYTYRGRQVRTGAGNGKAGSGSGGAAHVDNDGAKLEELIEKLAEYRTSMGFWPNKTKATGMCRGSKAERLALMKEGVNRGLIAWVRTKDSNGNQRSQVSVVGYGARK